MTKNASEWYHCSSYGTVLMHIAAHPHSTISEIADALCLTKRSVWGTIGALRRHGQLHVSRKSRHHHYIVNPDALFFHPTVTGVRIGDLIRGLRAAPSPPPAPQSDAPDCFRQGGMVPLREFTNGGMRPWPR